MLAAVGSVIQVVGKGAGLFKIAQNAGEQIHFYNDSTTSGTGGYIQANQRYENVELVCITDSVEWEVIRSVGNLTVKLKMLNRRYLYAKQS